MAAKYPEFQTPESYITPEGVKEGESFEDIATFKLKANGKICIVKVGDSPLYANKKDDEPEDYGTESGMTSRVTEAFRSRG